MVRKDRYEADKPIECNGSLAVDPNAESNLDDIDIFAAAEGAKMLRAYRSVNRSKTYFMENVENGLGLTERKRHQRRFRGKR